ncbi:MAG: hypothetical protein WAO06_00285 [Tenuifilaceae bacterium]|jgi:hypothetical protein
MEQINTIRMMPLAILIRLQGCALVACGGKRELGADRPHDSEADILRQLDEKRRTMKPPAL